MVSLGGEGELGKVDGSEAAQIKISSLGSWFRSEVRVGPFCVISISASCL